MASVLHLISDDDRRGAQLIAADLCDALAESGLSGEVVALRGNGSPTALPVDIAPATLRGRRELARRHDIVLAHGSTTLPVAAMIAPRRFVYRSIGDPAFWLDRLHRRVRTALAMRGAAGVVALYPGAATALHERARVPRERLHVIPNGRTPAAVDRSSDRDAARTELGLPPDAPVLLYVGSLSWEKQVDRLIDAAAAVPGAHLVCAGAGPLAVELDRRAVTALGERWHAVGSVADPTPHYAAADLLLMASRTEGMPGCVIEAGFQGTASVVTDVGGLATMVRDGETGRVVTPDDHTAYVAAIAEALPRADALGAAARDHMLSTYTMDAIAGPWRDVLLGALHSPAADQLRSLTAR